MGDIKFRNVRLVWHHSGQEIKPFKSSSSDDFPLSDFQTHCREHRTPSLCRTPSQQHGALSPTDHSFEIPPGSSVREKILAASLDTFAMFAARGNYALNSHHVFSTTGGTGTLWAPGDWGVSHKLFVREGEALRAVTKTFVDSDDEYCLYLEMGAGYSVSLPVGADEAAQLQAAHDVPDPHVVVRLSRAQGEYLSVSLVVQDPEDETSMEGFKLLAHPQDRTLYLAPLASVPRSVQKKLKGPGTLEFRVSVQYTDERPSLVHLSVDRLASVEVRTPLEDYRDREQEIARAQRHTEEMNFFLEFDVQFREEFAALWRPLTATELALHAAGDDRWKERRAAATARMIRNAPSIVYARRSASDSAEHERTLARLARRYSEPHAWDEALYLQHLAELARAQEVLILAHFAHPREVEAIRWRQVGEAFSLFASGALGTKKELAWRNGEPDSAFMFFWAEFADEVLRWHGPQGTGGLSRAQNHFWTKLRNILLQAAEDYRRYYRPSTECVEWSDYGIGTRRERALPAERTELSTFEGWKRLLERCFGSCD